ncbi:hypothetical protein [Ruegeria arenilitoris]|uniref:hypothetical protein n=1 Tax=Ruegeria arenilitoris TaxID=1173585 RepID=UPI00147F2FC4|nr:hypothetical protein [Ruegeria arenilitoris]
MIGISTMLAALAKAGSLFLLAIVFAVLIYSVLKLFQTKFELTEKEIRICAAIAVVFGSLALAAGVLLGASRESAADALIPALITFIGGIAVYLIGTTAANVLRIGVSVVCFSFLLIVGTTLGYYERYESDLQALEDQYDLRILKWKADVEYRINTYRKNKGLGPAF